MQLRSGNTSSARFWGDAPDKYYNGAFDIRQDGMYDANCPLFSALPAADIYYVRIGNKYFKLHYNPNYTEPPYIINYGDMMFEYIGGNVSLASKSTGCAYDVYGPYDWQEKTITLRNDFGGDKMSCSGNIHFNSELLTNVGYVGASLKREAQTFPHTVSGIDNQYVNNFYRKWRNWEDLNSTISKTLSSVNDYSITAIYTKKINVALRNKFVGGKIIINYSSQNCPLQNFDFYEDNSYQIQALNQTENAVSYQFLYWNYNDATLNQNPLTINNPASHINLTAVFTGTPSFQGSSRNLSIQQIINAPVRITWVEHPNSDVSHYKIYRKVKDTPSWINGEHLATLSRGTTSFNDPDFNYSNNARTTLLYDVRAYCQAYGTESAPSFQGPAYGELVKSANLENSDELGNTLDNFPNPFNPTTRIYYSIKENSFVLLQIYDVLGNKVAELVNEYKPAGQYSVDFNASDKPSGIYICTIKANNYTSTKKMLLVK